MKSVCGCVCWGGGDEIKKHLLANIDPLVHVTTWDIPFN